MPTRPAALADEIAPEHLHIATENAAALAEKILHAGAIFLGNYTPVALGDYAAGPSHVLPDQRHGPLRRRPVGQRLPPRQTAFCTSSARRASCASLAAGRTATCWPTKEGLTGAIRARRRGKIRKMGMGGGKMS